ncbi:isopeptide-forming domain-containing fimbrial protein [Streptomyces sp. NPDC058052]|uniref:isopeptide-forming domain-containing fimbrial protein n=1 Tax=Streptomyces sp. NPDC058052 TaxID=3346316 RepID=UPI0036E2D8DD
MSFVRSHPSRVLAAGLLAASTLSAATAGPAAADVVEPFGLRYQASLYGDFTTIGNTVMGCPTAPAGLAARCAAATKGEGSDHDDAFVMRRLDTDGTGGAYGSSTGRIRIPEGAEVAYARLSWGGSDGTYRGPGGTSPKRCAASGADVDPSPGDPATTAPLLSVGGRKAAPVSIDSMVVDPADTVGPHHYTGESDVTAAFAGVSGTDAPVAVGVGGVWAPGGKGCVAGWSLTVVHRFPGPGPAEAPERRSVHVYGGHVLQRPASPATTITVDGFHRSPGKARAGVTAYEGDGNTPGDRFLVGGKNVTEARTGGTDNFFVGGDDGAVSPDLADNLSLDAKEFDVPDGAIPVGATSAELTFATSGDTYVPAGLVLSVPVPDLEVTKAAHPRTVEPGGTVTYTITAKNVSGLDHPDASFTDDLTGVLDDAAYAGDAKADLGEATYRKQRIHWTGDIPAGKTATVTYAVTVKDPATGDGKLGGAVEVTSPRSTCGKGSEDPACAVAPVVETPDPAPSPSAPTPPEPADPDPAAPADPDPAASADRDATAEPTGPAPSPSVTTAVAPAPGPGHDGTGGGGSGTGSTGSGGSMAETGGDGERLWLLGALAVVLAATGLVAKAAMRGRRIR